MDLLVRYLTSAVNSQCYSKEDITDLCRCLWTDITVLAGEIGISITICEAILCVVRHMDVEELSDHLIQLHRTALSAQVANILSVNLHSHVLLHT